MRPGVPQGVVNAAELPYVGALLREAKLQGVVVGIGSVLEFLFLAKAAIRNIGVEAGRRDAVGIRIREGGQVSRNFVEEALGIGAVEGGRVEGVDVDKGGQTMG